MAHAAGLNPASFVGSNPSAPARVEIRSAWQVSSSSRPQPPITIRESVGGTARGEGRGGARSLRFGAVRSSLITLHLSLSEVSGAQRGGQVVLDLRLWAGCRRAEQRSAPGQRCWPPRVVARASCPCKSRPGWPCPVLHTSPRPGGVSRPTGGVSVWRTCFAGPRLFALGRRQSFRSCGKNPHISHRRGAEAQRAENQEAFLCVSASLR